MNSLWRIFFCIVLLGLAGCVIKEKIMANPPALNQCKMICVQHFESCKQHCTNNCPTCSADSSYTSTSNYLKYLHERQVQGGFVTRGLKSYRDPLQCRKVTCNCTSDFITCNQGCTGVIQKRLRSVPYCT